MKNTSMEPSVLPPFLPFLQEVLKNCRCFQNGEPCAFWIFRGDWVKMREWILSVGSWGFSESNFQLLMKYHIRWKNVNYNNNRNHNVLYLLTFFKCLQLVNWICFMNKEHSSVINLQMKIVLSGNLPENSLCTM